MTQRPYAVFALSAENVPLVFPPPVLARLREAVDVDSGLVAEDLADPRVKDAVGYATF